MSAQRRIAERFTRSVSWVCKHQRRAVDPMPRDLPGAITWGQRLGLLPEFSVQTPAVASPRAAIEEQDLALKRARTSLLERELQIQSGDLLTRAQVEAREAANAAEFRLAAQQFALRARAIVERRVEPAVVEQIARELEPVAADLLNHADPQGVLTGLSADQAREKLLARMEELLKCL